MKQVELSKKTFGVCRLIPNKVLENLPPDSEVQAYFDGILHGMVLEIRSKIWGQKVKTLDIEIPVELEYSYKTPSSWWQHFKLDHFPDWLVRRFPVRFQTYTETSRVIARDKLEAFALYPDWDYKLPPDLGYPVLYAEGDFLKGRIFDSFQGGTVDPRSSED